MDRPDAFELALSVLRARLRDGVYPPGSRVPASRLAEELRLSATPIREALALLTGEGVLEERRNQGFFARTLTGLDVADLYRLSLAEVGIALSQRGLATRDLGVRRQDGDPAAAVRAVEDLFLGWMADAASSSLFGAYRTLMVQLGPIRRVEPRILTGLDREADDLLVLQGANHTPDRLAALRRFHGRRIAAAETLATLVNRRDRREPF